MRFLVVPAAALMLLGLFACGATSSDWGDVGTEDYELRYINHLLSGGPLSQRRSPPRAEEEPSGPPAAAAEPSPVPSGPGPAGPPTRARPGGPPGGGAGGLPRETVRQVIGSHYPEIQACYEKALAKNPKLKGRLIMKFLLSASGKVMKAAIEKDSPGQGSKDLDACLVKVAAKWTFPAPPEGKQTMVTSDPFVFE